MKKLQVIPRHSLRFVVITTAGASSISLIGGIGIEAVTHRLLPLVPLLIALPALNTMVGDYAAIIAAHAGDPAERTKTRHELVSAISKSIVINILGVIGLSLWLASRKGYLIDAAFATRFGIFIAVSIIAVVATMFVLTYFVDRLLAKSHLNPDDILIPVVTTITDVLMLFLIAASTLTIF